MKKMMLKSTILIIGMATVMAGAAISPALGLIEDAFPEASETTIKLILTIPSMMIVPFSFVSSYLTKIIQKRTIILIGLIIYLIGGVGPQFFTSIEMIILLRLILGVGVGLVMPMSTALINDHYTGAERTKMMGYESAFNNLGGILTMVIAGWLGAFGWSAPFNVYLIGIFIFIFTYLFIPPNDLETTDGTDEKSKKLPLKAYGYSIAMGAVMLIYYSIATNIALYLKENNIGGSDLAGIVGACTTIGGMLTSMLLIQVESVFKRYIIPVMLVCMSIAFLILSITYSIPLIMISVVMVGLAQGVLFPIITLRALDVTPPHLASQTVAWVSSLTFLGQFLSPVVMDSVSTLFNQHTIRFQYSALTVSVGAFAIGSVISIYTRPKSNKQTAKQE